MLRYPRTTVPLTLLLTLGCIGSVQATDAELDTAISKLSEVNSTTKPHPRFLNGSTEFKGIVNKAINTDEGKYALNNVIRVFSGGPKSATGDGRYSVEKLKTVYVTQLDSFKAGNIDSTTWNEISRQVEATAEAAYAYYVKGDPTYLAEVSKRLDVLAQPIIDRGCREYPVNGTAISIGDTNYYRREYVWYFGLAYDFAQQGLTDVYKKKIAEVIAKCVAVAAPSTLANVNTPNTYQNMESNTLAKFAAGMLLVHNDAEFVKDDIKPAFDYLPAMTKAYVGRLHMFGGNDGGYANSSAYSLFDTAPYLPMWDVFDRVLGYSPYEKRDFVKYLPNFELFTLPPESPEGAFGDGAEVDRTEERARFLRAIFSRSASSQVSRWFKNTYLNNIRLNSPANAQYGSPKYGDIQRLDFLLSPSEDSTVVAEPTPYLRYWFPSVGIGAMHSSLSDPSRTSVFFKSGPFGSENHAHADQNSFVIYHKGKVFASDSGVNADYGHAHRVNYSKTTKAHNAITYDQGTGQELGDAYGSDKAKGKLLSANDGVSWGQPLTKGTVQYDLVTGDASEAYGKTNGVLNLKKALRTLVFIRPSTVVVYDQLESAAKKWEYNLHTVVEPKLNSTSNEDVVTIDGVRMCVQVKSAGPIARETPTLGYPANAAPQDGKPIRHDHWWSRYVYQTANTKGMFVSVYRLDCPAIEASTPYTISVTDSANAMVTLPGAKVVLSNGVVTVQ